MSYHQTSPILTLSPLRHRYQSPNNYTTLTTNISPFVFKPSTNPFTQLQKQSQSLASLHQLIHQKNLQITQLYEQITQINKQHERQILSYEQKIKQMQGKLTYQEIQKINEINVQREREKLMMLQHIQHNKKQQQQLTQVRVQYLIKQLLNIKSINQQLSQKLTSQQFHIQQLNYQHQQQLSKLTQQLQSSHQLHELSAQSNQKQLSYLNSKRELQKSRTSNLIQSRRQNHNFIDKQLRGMNEELLEKQIQIQALTRELTKCKKDSQKTMKKNNDMIIQLKESHLQQMQQHMNKSNKKQHILTQQLKHLKSSILTHLSQIQSLTSLLHQTQQQLQQSNLIIYQKTQQLCTLKQSIQTLKQQHTKQLNNLMKQRRKSKSRIGSSRSIISLKDSGIILMDSPKGKSAMMEKDIEKDKEKLRQSVSLQRYNGSSSVEENSMKLEKNLPLIKEENTPDRHEIKDYSRELAASQSFSSPQPQAQSALQQAIYHYDSLISQLKRNHQSQLSLYLMNEKSQNANYNKNNNNYCKYQ